MDGDFFIKDSEKIGNTTLSFGVFSDKVYTPDTFVCQKSDRQFYRLFYVVNGLIIFNRGTKNELRAPAGNIVYLPSDIAYKSEWPKGEIGEFITFNFQIVSDLITLPDKICIAAVDKSGRYLEMFKNALDIWMQGAVGYKLKILSELYKILYSLQNDSLRRYTKLNYQTIYKGIIFLENNYLSDCTAHELAEMCNTSEGNFRRLFRKYKNMSPVAYRNYLRIQKACDLLTGGEYSIAEAAAAVNIPDVCYFYKLFAKYKRTTPKAYLANAVPR